MVMKQFLSTLVLIFSLLFSTFAQAGGSCTDLFAYVAPVKLVKTELSKEEKPITKEDKPIQKISISEKDLSALSPEEIKQKALSLVYMANQTLNAG